MSRDRFRRSRSPDAVPADDAPPDRFPRAARQLGKRLRRRQWRLADLAAIRVRLALWTAAQGGRR